MLFLSFSTHFNTAMCDFTLKKDIKKLGFVVFGKGKEIQHWESGQLAQGIIFKIERISVQTSLVA